MLRSRVYRALALGLVAVGLVGLSACDAGSPTPPLIPAGPATDPAGTDVAIELPEGDPVRGGLIAQARGCTACHITGAPNIGPAWESAKNPDGLNSPGIAASRVAADDYNGVAKTPEEYIFESIVSPNVDIVPPTTGANWVIAGPSTMLTEYGTLLSKQDLADIIAYLKTVK